MSPRKPLTWAVLELIGLTVFGIALCFSLIFYPIVYSKVTKRDANQIKSEMTDREARLRSAGLSDELVEEIVAHERASLIRDSTHTFFIICTFVIVGLGVVSLGGLGLFLWARLRSIEDQVASLFERRVQEELIAGRQAEFVSRRNAIVREFKRFEGVWFLLFFGALLLNVWLAYWCEGFFDERPALTIAYLTLFFGGILANIPLFAWVVRRAMRKHGLMCTNCGGPIVRLDAQSAPERCDSCGAPWPDFAHGVADAETKCVDIRRRDELSAI